MPWTPAPGGGGGGEGLPLLAGSASARPKKHGGPFINWHSPGSILSAIPRATAAGAQDIGDLTLAATRGTIGLGADIGKETWHGIEGAPHQINLLAHGKWSEASTRALESAQSAPAQQPILTPRGLEEYSRQHPATGALLGSLIRTGQDVEQVGRAGINTVLPGQPAGSNVGQLGSGPGLLGRTQFAEAAKRGGPGVLPKVVEDVANLVPVGKAVEGVLGSAATTAAAESATHEATAATLEQAGKSAAKDASRAVQDAAKEARTALEELNKSQAAAPPGDLASMPGAAADVAAKQNAYRGAQESLRQAQEYAAQVGEHHQGILGTAREAAAVAGEHARKLKGHVETAKLINNLGLSAANSPFAPLFGGEVDLGAGRTLRIPGALQGVGKAAKALAGTETGAKYIGPLIERVAEHARKREDVNTADRLLGEGMEAGAETGARMDRMSEALSETVGTLGRRGRVLADPVAEGVAMMYLTGEGRQLAQVLHSGLDPEVALDVVRRSSKSEYAPEVWDLAADVFGQDPQGRAAEIAAALPEVERRFRERSAQATADYAAMKGDVEPIMQEKKPLTAGALEHAQHNVAGTGPNVEHTEQWAAAQGKHAKRAAVLNRELDRAERDLAVQIARGQRMYGRAREKMGAPTRVATERLNASTKRVVDAASKLGQLRERLVAAQRDRARLEGTDPFAHAGIDRREVVGAIKEVREALKADFAEQAAALVDEMSRMGIESMRWPPPKEQRRTMVRRGPQKGQRVFRTMHAADTIGEDVHAIAQSGLTRDSRFFHEGGSTPEELVNQWRSARGEAPSSMGGPDVSVEDWLDMVRTVKQLEDAAKPSAMRGWDPAKFGQARGEIMGHLSSVWGQEAAQDLAGRVAFGHPAAVADDIVGRLGEHMRAELSPEVRVASGDVAQALEQDRRLEVERGIVSREGRSTLNTSGRRLYDEQVGVGKAAVQGQVVEQRSRGVLGEAQASADQARAQGRREGRLAGMAEQMPKAAESRYARVERALAQNDRLLARRYDQLMADNQVSAPRRWKPFLKLGEDIHKDLLAKAEEADREFGPGAGDVYASAAGEVIVSMDEMTKQGIDPAYVIGERPTPELSQTRTAGARGASLPVAAPSGHRVQGTGATHATNLKDLAVDMKRRALKVVATETAQRIIDVLGAKPRELLAKEIGAEELAKMSGEDVAAAMRERGYSAWNYSDRRGNLRSDHAVNLDTSFVPTSVWRHYTKYTSDYFSDNRGLAAYDRAMRTWKSSILALTGRWHAGNIFGNAILGMVGAGVGPLDYAHHVGMARRLLKMGAELTPEDHAYLASLPEHVRAALDESAYAPAALLRRGPTADIAGQGALERPAGSALRHPIQRSYAFNGFVDDLNRTAIFLAKLDEGLDAATLADFRKAFPELAHLDDAGATREAAIRLSLRAAGDFTKMTAFERGVIRRFIPFYPWLRHITKLTGNLAIHHPLRVAWALHLPSLYDPGEAPVDWMHGLVPLGGDQWLRNPNWNPFADVGRTFDPDQPFGSVSPIIGAAAATTLGIDLRRRSRITRAPDTGAGGREGLTPLFGRWKELGYYLGSQVPQVQAGREALPALIGHEPVVRYQSGEPIVSRGRFIPSNQQQWLGTNARVPGPVAPFLPLTGLPQQQLIDADAIAAAAQARGESAAKARQTYAKRRKLAARR